MTGPALTIGIIYNTSLHVLRARMRLIAHLRSHGCRVVLFSPVDEALADVLPHIDAHVSLRMSQYGMNPLNELRMMRQIRRELARQAVDICLNYTIKPNIFGTLAAGKLGLPVINNVAGAGRAFTSGRPVFRVFIKTLYRKAFKKSSRVFFQNSDDYRLFLEAGILPEAKARCLPGSGVDLIRFSPSPLPQAPIRFLFVGRLLEEKGVVDFLAAGRGMIADGLDVRIEFVGERSDLPGYIPEDVLRSAVQDDRVTYHGAVEPSLIPDLIRQASCIVLPSYYGEGVPRTLLEASASRRPVITTDNVGCRDAVDPGVTGYMVPTRDVKALKDAMVRFVALDQATRDGMADAARRKMEQEFDEQIVLDAYLNEIADLTGRNFNIAAAV